MYKFVESKNVSNYKIITPNLEIIKQSGLPQLAKKWGQWKAQSRPGSTKPAKIPYGAAGKISVSEPDSWLTFTDAAELYGQGNFDGIGMLMTSTDNAGEMGLVGLDLDLCLDEHGGVLETKTAIISDFIEIGGYVELSPSGTGLRQFVRGFRLEDYRQKTTANNLEVYDTDDVRYLTVTGVPYPVGSLPRQVIQAQIPLEKFIIKWCERMPNAEPLSLQDCNCDVEARTASEVLAMLKTRNKRGKITRLLNGDSSDYAGRSEADLGFCCEAAYYCRSAQVIDALLRQSGLMRAKWDERRGRLTYGQRTIKKALELQTHFFDIDQIEVNSPKPEKQLITKDEKSGNDIHLIGGGEDLRRGKGWRADLYALTELLLRDRRLLGAIYFDEFSGYPIITRSFRSAFDDPTAPDTVGRFTDCHYRCVARWFGKQWKINIRLDQVIGVAATWSQKVRRNPVRERLEELELIWDGKKRLADWLINYCSASKQTDDGTDITEYLQAVGSRWILSAVARAMNPGCKVDCMLILEGKQGARKSSGVRALAEALGGDYFREGFSLESGKDDKIALRGRLVIEWGELAGMGKKDREHLKNFLSLQTDSYRGVYGLTETDWPRTAVFCGTTNEGQYLADPSGNRRFWPVKVGRIDIEKLKDEAKQIWAEAVTRWKAGDNWWFDDDDPKDARIIRLTIGEQERRLGGAVWDEVAADVADKLVCGTLKLNDSGDIAKYENHFSVEQMKIWLSGSVENSAKFDDSLWRQVTDGLKRANWMSRRISGRMRWQITGERCDDLCRKFGILRASQKRIAQPRK